MSKSIILFAQEDDEVLYLQLRFRIRSVFFSARPVHSSQGTIQWAHSEICRSIFRKESDLYPRSDVHSGMLLIARALHNYTRVAHVHQVDDFSYLYSYEFHCETLSHCCHMCADAPNEYSKCAKSNACSHYTKSFNIPGGSKKLNKTFSYNSEVLAVVIRLLSNPPDAL